MMNKIRTRAVKTDSVMSVNKDKIVDVGLQTTSKPITFTNVQTTIDQYEQFLAERSVCTKHRLIVTLVPYCTNVLFNTLTEVVWHEGGDDADAPKGGDNAVHTNTNEVLGNLIPTRREMVDNTEYSKEEIGYVYHPGFDIFNNHVIRNKSFKVVNPPMTTGDKSFNTIEDMQRRPDASQVEFTPRVSISDALNTKQNKHLYDADDIMSFDESINSNLTEENGWFGFINVSSIDSREGDIQTNNPESLNISRVLNNHLRCEFIDMYPDRTLFSFSPKYNPYRKRLEHNWDVLITYPYKSDYNHPLTKNGLLIAQVQKVSGYNGRDILLFRTYTKHGLSQGDSLYFYYSADGSSFNRTESMITVTSLGDLNKNDNEHWFYTTDVSLIRDALGDGYWYNDTGNWLKNETETNNAFKSMTFTLKRIYNGHESDYYLRQFRKLPNFRKTPVKLSEETGQDRDKFNDFITTSENNIIDGNNIMRQFAREHYKLAFANTIYGDDIAQTTFSDDIDIENIVDNLGRPLSEIYITVIKTNRGHEEFYDDNKPGNEKVEYSHCFGKIRSGINFDMGHKDFATVEWHEKRKGLSDIGVIDSELPSEPLEKDITQISNEFYGDLAEFNAYECRERILDIVQHRFNTVQRDTGKLGTETDLYYHEFSSDDYDKSGFKVDSIEVLDALKRPEGYYYQPHYRIPVKSFGDIQQASHWIMKIRNAQPESTRQGMMVSIQTRLPHHLSSGDLFYICDPYDDEWIKATVFSVKNSTTFLFSPFIRDDNGDMNDKLTNWVKLCDILNASDENRRYKFYKHNDEIPNYAIKVGSNMFLWRPSLPVGDSEATGLPEYPFANGRFYIHRPIELYLKRQDPHGYNGLYAKDSFPNDIVGKKLATSNYEYKDEKMVTC